jgi:lipopolysaccharide assembly protein A
LAAVRLIYWLTTLVVAIGVAVFAVNNGERIPVDLWPFMSLEVPLYLVALLPLLLGLVMGGCIAWVSGRHWRQQARLRERRIETLERELDVTRTQLPAHSASGD